MSEKQILIDGYNLLYASGLLTTRRGQRKLQQARQELLTLLASKLSPEQRRQVVIVFDAGRAAPKDSRDEFDCREMRVMFAHRHVDADDLLEKLIRQASRPALLTVVSSDRRLQRAAARRGAHAVASDQWLYELPEHAPPSARPPDVGNDEPRECPSPEEVEYWLREFERPAE
jgi:predicted RNA-binding protein with PIN domain